MLKKFISLALILFSLFAGPGVAIASDEITGPVYEALVTTADGSTSYFCSYGLGSAAFDLDLFPYDHRTPAPTLPCISVGVNTAGPGQWVYHQMPGIEVDYPYITGSCKQGYPSENPTALYLDGTWINCLEMGNKISKEMPRNDYQNGVTLFNQSDFTMRQCGIPSKIGPNPNALLFYARDSHPVITNCDIGAYAPPVIEPLPSNDPSFYLSVTVQTPKKQEPPGSARQYNTRKYFTGMCAAGRSHGLQIGELHSPGNFRENRMGCWMYRTGPNDHIHP